MNKKDLITAVREEIARQGISDYELAKRAGLYGSNIQRFNSPDWGQQIETLCKIAQAVGLDITVTKKVN